MMKGEDVVKLVQDAYESGIYMGRKIGSEPSQSFMHAYEEHMQKRATDPNYGVRITPLKDPEFRTFDKVVLIGKEDLFEGYIISIDHGSQIASVHWDKRGTVGTHSLKDLKRVPVPTVVKESGDMIDPEWHRGYLQGRMTKRDEMRPVFDKMVRTLQTLPHLYPKLTDEINALVKEASKVVESYA